MNDFRLEDEIRLPSAAMRTLVGAARVHGEPVEASIRDAGRAAGQHVAGLVSTAVPLGELDLNDFWSAVNAETGARGLGTFEWESAIGGHAELRVHDPAESADPGTSPEMNDEAPFTEGFIEGLLGVVAGEPVGVVLAPADGSRALRFVLGSPTALRHVRLRLAHGAALDEALEGI